jgi:hypothetical protein
VNYAANSKYFATTHYGWPAVLIVIGVLALAASPAGGIVFIAVGGGWLAFQLMGKPNDSALDASITAEMSTALSTALGKMNLDPSQVQATEPIVTGGYVYGGGTTKYRKGADGQWRSNQAEVAVVAFSDDVAHSWKRNFSLTEPKTRDDTDEYFYRDVVSIATSSGSKTVTYKGKPQEINFQTLKLSTAGGAFECSILNDDISRTLKGGRELIMAKKRS